MDYGRAFPWMSLLVWIAIAAVLIRMVLDLRRKHTITTPTRLAAGAVLLVAATAGVLLVVNG